MTLLFILFKGLPLTTISAARGFRLVAREVDLEVQTSGFARSSSEGSRSGGSDGGKCRGREIMGGFKSWEEGKGESKRRGGKRERSVF